MITICRACGLPVGSDPQLPQLPKTKERILVAVRRRPGITAEDLRAIVWDGPDGGPEDRKVLHVHVHQLNRLIAPLGIVVRAQKGGVGGYRIRALKR
jgi:hypothetical protein